MSKEILEELEDWKLEAKLEQSGRYFYHTRVVERIARGKKCYVIGRKGTGKTAIGEHLAHLKEKEYFASKLTFKNFPFNILYSQRDESYTRPNQYISIWKYLIYISVCKLFEQNADVGIETRLKLRELFNQDIENALPNAVTEWTGWKFDLKILGSGLGFGADKGRKEKAEVSISERNEILENFIRGQLGKSTYVILFDELDEDYKNMLAKENFENYTELLTSLFKAVQDVRARFSTFRLYPVVFLRDDIYDILQDPDKTKWEDYRVNLDWSRESLQQLLAFRISRAINPTGRVLPFAEAWGAVFTGGKVRYGQNNQTQTTSFDYITRSTQNRPRDYIRYIQVCAERSLEKNNETITPDVVKAQDKAFSNYLKSELQDEIHGAIPEIKDVFTIFTELRKQTLSIGEFKEQYNLAVKSGRLPKRDVSFILEILFMFSVIGNVPKQSTFQVFKYTNPDARLNFNEKICVHRGLFKALQIL
ncbi:P-loop ATPase, Sll1717 family [Pseudomonas aeruginosa]